MAYKIVNIREVLDKGRRCHVVDLSNDLYQVTSPTSGKAYQVDLHRYTCTCERQKYVGIRNGFVNGCSHVQGAMVYSWLLKGYWLVARKSGSANLRHYKRKIVLFATNPDAYGDDGVIFTARQIPAHRVKNHLARLTAS
jgi:hypothetical protein